MTGLVSLFGSLQVCIDGRVLGPSSFSGRKPKQLLEILLLHEGRPLRKDQLAELLWSGPIPERFSETIEHYVSLLRKRLDPGGRPALSMVGTVHGGYRFVRGDLQVDTVSFDRIYQRHQLATATRLELDAAVQLVRGVLLEDEPYADWSAGPRSVYALRYVELLNAAAQAALAEGDASRGVELASAAVHRDAYLETGHRLLMLALYAQGRQYAALAAFDRCREILVGELGIVPLPETARLHALILAQVPAPDLLRQYAGARSPAAALTPGPTLVPISVPDVRRPENGSAALPFVARDLEMATLLRTVAVDTGRSASVIILAGQPGSGKTRTLAELATRLQGRTVIRLNAVTAECTLAGAAMAQLLARLCIGDPRLSDVLPAVPAAWDGTPTQRAGIANQIVAMVMERSPFTVLFDDAENIDDVSAQMLACLATRIPASRAAFVFACRSGCLAGAHALATTENVTRVTLEPLSKDEVGIFQVDGLFERTGGLPLFVAREIAQQDSGVPGAGGDELDTFRRLGDELFHLGVLAAILHGPIRPEPLARAVGRDPIVVVGQLETLSALGILSAAGAGFVFRNQAIKDRLAKTASPSRRQLLRARARATEAPKDRRRSNMQSLVRDRRSGEHDRRAERRRDDEDSGLSTTDTQPVPTLRSVPETGLPQHACCVHPADQAEDSPPLGLVHDLPELPGTSFA